VSRKVLGLLYTVAFLVFGYSLFMWSWSNQRVRADAAHTLQPQDSRRETTIFHACIVTAPWKIPARHCARAERVHELPQRGRRRQTEYH
jgi:HAMP domain-containing protein